MVTRRGNKEGCISKRKDGRWQGYVSMPNGKRRSVSRRTRKEVADELTRLRSKQLDGGSLETSKLTVGTFVDRWIEDTKRIGWKKTTLERARILLRKHIGPRIGHLLLSRLTRQHLNQMQTEMETADPPVGISTRWLSHRLIKSALEHAVDCGDIPANPARKANRPTIPEKEYVTFSGEQLSRFCNAVNGTEFEALFIVAALTGLRLGEVLGLQWDDIDFDAGSISIKRTLTQISRHEFITETPKTKSSARTIRPHGRAIDALQRHRERMERNHPESALVFVWKDGGPVPRRSLARRFKKLLKAAKLPEMRFHDLRHTVGTLLMEAGENAKIVKELLGHSNVSVTLQIYSHATDQMTANAANKLGALVKDEPAETVAEL